MDACIRQIRILAALALTITVFSAHAQNWEQGVHYQELSNPQPVKTGEKIEVLEIFWYGCPHCYALEPFMEHWVSNKPANAEYVLMPGIFRPDTKFHGRAFYTFEALNITDQVHRDFYDELHQRGNRIYNLSGLLEYMAGHGVSQEEFKNAFDSFAVDANVRSAENMFRKYEATGTPTIIVDGRYRLTVSSAGGHEQLLQLINFLVDKATSERPS